MTGEPYTALERADAFREELRESGHWQIKHTDDPSFIVARRPKEDR